MAWAEETIEETLTSYRLPRQHHKDLKSTNMLEHLNDKIRRRTHVVRIFPNAAFMRLAGAALATHENWLEAQRYPNMDDLKEHKKPISEKPLSPPAYPPRFAELDAHIR